MTQLTGHPYDAVWARWALLWGERPPEGAVLDLIERLKVEGRRRVDDLGCGLGRHLVALAAEGFDASGSDISPAAVAECRRRLEQTGLAARVELADMAEIPAADGSLDAVVAWDVLYHATLRAIKDTMAAIRRKLGPGGYLLATFNSVESTSCRESRWLAAVGDAIELEPNTFVVPGDVLGDKTVPHHYTTASELREELLQGFEVLSMGRYRGPKYVLNGRRHGRVLWHVLARKEQM